LAAMADDSRVQLLAKINDPATSTQDRATYIDAMNKINTNLDADFALIDKGEEPQHMKEFFRWQANPTGYTATQPANTNAPVAQGVGSSGVVRKYNSHEEVLSALKGVDAGTAVQILRANNMTVEDLRKIGQPKTNYPKTQEAAKQKRPHEMTPEELKKADVEYWNKWKTAAGRVSPIAPKSPSEQAAEFNKAVEYNRQLAEWAKKRNLFGQR